MISFAPLEPDAARFLSERTGQDYSRADFSQERWLCASARTPGGELQAVLVGEFKQPWHCYLSMAVEDMRCVSPKLMMAIFAAIFSRAARCTITVPTDNERSLQQLHLLGFQYEGFLRRGFDGVRDAAIFGMLPEDSVWLERARRRAERHRRPPPIIDIGGDHGRPA